MMDAVSHTPDPACRSKNATVWKRLRKGKLSHACAVPWGLNRPTAAGALIGALPEPAPGRTAIGAEKRHEQGAIRKTQRSRANLMPKGKFGVVDAEAHRQRTL